MSVLSSLKNPRVMLARKLHRRRGRVEERAFLVEGPQGVSQALEADAPILDLFVTEGFDGEVLEQAEAAGARAVAVSDQVMRAISDTTTPQGVAAIVAMPESNLRSAVAQADLVLVLDEVRDPGNAGTLMRSARAAGARAVIFTRGSVDPYAPKTVRSSAGSLLGLHVVTDVGFEEAAGELKESGFRLIGANAAAEGSMYGCDMSSKVAIVLGNEAWGIPEGSKAGLDEEVSIPMPGPVESLNVAMAGSLLLFEVVRQRLGHQL